MPLLLPMGWWDFLFPLLAAVLFIWTIRRVRRMPPLELRPYCPNCDYCLSGLNSPATCPECGKDLHLYPPLAGSLKTMRGAEVCRIVWILACVSLLLALQRWLPSKEVSFPGIDAADQDNSWYFRGGFRCERWIWPGRPLLSRQSGPSWWELNFPCYLLSERNVEPIHGWLSNHIDPGQVMIELSAAGYEITTYGGAESVAIARGPALDDQAIERWFQVAKVDLSGPQSHDQALFLGRQLDAILRGSWPPSNRQGTPFFDIGYMHGSWRTPVHPWWLALPTYGVVLVLARWGWRWINRRTQLAGTEEMGGAS